MRRKLRKLLYGDDRGHTAHPSGDLARAPSPKSPHSSSQASRCPSCPSGWGQPAARWQNPTLPAPPRTLRICGNKCDCKFSPVYTSLGPHDTSLRRQGPRELLKNCNSGRVSTGPKSDSSSQVRIPPSRDSSASSLIQHLKAFFAPHRRASGRMK